MSPFREGKFDPLTKQEQKLVDFCKKASENSYVIGTTSSAEYFEETIKHEFVHGAFYTNLEYRKEVIACIKNFGIEPIDKCLLKMGYCNEVLTDETNAYVLVEPDTIQEYVSVNNTKNLRDNLDKIFVKYFGFSVLKTEIPALMSRTEHVLV